MLGEILAHRRLVARLAINDFRGRYYGSVLGTVWAVVQPLTMIVMYTLIFAVVLKVKVGVKGSVTEFGLFLICGMIPFNSVADAVRRASGVYLEQAHMMRRIPMPPVVLPASRVLTSMFELGIVLVLFIDGTSNREGYPILPPDGAELYYFGRTSQSAIRKSV